MKFILVVAFAVFPLIGFACFIIPQFFVKEIDLASHSSNLQELVTYSYKKVIFLPTMVLLVLSGIITGFVVKRLCVLLGMSSIIVFLLVAIYEIMTQPSSHSLWPIEFIVYFVFSIPAIIGACIGKNIAERQKDQ